MSRLSLANLATTPVPVAEVLGPAGLAHARRFGGARRAAQGPAPLVDPLALPPDPRLVARLGPAVCLRRGVLPWRKIGGETVVLAARPEQFAQMRDALVVLFGPVRMARAELGPLQTAIAAQSGPDLVRAAEARVEGTLSCRNWRTARVRLVGVAVALGLAGAAVAAPGVSLAGLTGIATLALLAATALKLAALVLHLRREAQSAGVTEVPAELPVISVLVPLFRERQIAGHLLRRLEQISYPRDRLEICLVLEQDDHVTRQTLAETALPGWMRAVVVPRGTLKTKPRALNYALDFTRGEIIGVYDAEDAPAPDQLLRVAGAFAAAAPDVACLQGVLDFYNPRWNWLARCFTLEYGAWFRVILPGLQRMGLVIPLGGTTLFFRRHILEELGGWDAHNVTEDADLGVRLARRGYRTELIATVTEEEANARPLAWVRQRSRWLKGYAITYGVHMRAPRRLWSDLGPWRFAGLQVMFGGTLLQFVLAPVLWSFWLVAFAQPHPLTAVLPGWVFWVLGGVFAASELVNLALHVAGARAAGKPWLSPWALSLNFYFPLAALAAYKGLIELGLTPFYWDKTAHGRFLPPEGRGIAAIRRPRPPRHQASAA